MAIQADVCNLKLSVGAFKGICLKADGLNVRFVYVSLIHRLHIAIPVKQWQWSTEQLQVKFVPRHQSPVTTPLSSHQYTSVQCLTHHLQCNICLSGLSQLHLLHTGILLCTTKNIVNYQEWCNGQMSGNQNFRMFSLVSKVSCCDK